MCKRIDAWFAFNPLSEVERKVVFLHLLQGKTQREVANVIGKSQQTVSLYAKRAIDKMTDYINNWPDKEKVS